MNRGLEALNEEFGIHGRIRFVEVPGGLTVAEIENRYCKGRIALQGAQVLEWRPFGVEPVLWVSPHAKYVPGKSVRGGVPVCWPWFGPHATEPALPAHGFARNSPWQVVESSELDGDETRLVLELVQGGDSCNLWPFSSSLTAIITMGRRLHIELITSNFGNEPFLITEALHTYFHVSDVRQIAIQGLEGHTYIDKVAGGERRVQEGPVTFSEETDRVYVNSSGSVVIGDPGLRRRIQIESDGSRSIVVWNPWLEKSNRLGDMGADGYLHMVCVETANAADNGVTVDPQATHRLAVTIAL